MPCSKEGGCTCKKENVPMRNRVLCSNWHPSQNSKYYNCEFYELEQQPCPFEDSNGQSPCDTCEYYAKLEGKGRPNTTGVDWENPEQVREYNRKRYYARKNKSDSGAE